VFIVTVTRGRATVKRGSYITQSDFLFGHRIVRAQLVDRAVGQMGKGVVEVVQRVLVRAEPGQSLPVHVYGERMERRHQHVQPQVVLVAADQHRVLHVPLHYDVRVVFEFVDLLQCRTDEF